MAWFFQGPIVLVNYDTNSLSESLPIQTILILRYTKYYRLMRS